MDVRALSYEETESLLPVADCVSAIQRVYVEEGKGSTVNRPRSHSFLKHSSGVDGSQDWYCFKTMEGGVKDTGYVALRVSSGPLRVRSTDDGMRHEFVATVTAASGEKRFLELILLFRVYDGTLLAIMPGGYIQKMRVGSTTALASKHMARPHSEVLGLIGSGGQAAAQLLAHKEYFPLKHVKVYSTTPSHRERFADVMGDTLGVPVEAVTTAEEAVRESDIVVSATGSHAPTFRGEWLAEGTHWGFITQTEGGADAFARSDRIVVHSHVTARNVVAPVDANELPLRVEQFGISVEDYPTLADLVAGRVRGREKEDEITCFVTTQGLGTQFVALASLAYERALERDVGTVQNWDHLLQDVNW